MAQDNPNGGQDDVRETARLADAIAALNAVLVCVDAQANTVSGVTRGYLRELAEEIRADFDAEPGQPIVVVVRLREAMVAGGREC